jgi:dTDP-4-amino-4,6-dideoxygalactose transaminase
MGSDELELVKEAFASNWIAPLGPHVDAFEAEFAALVGSPYAAALSSGTAALHLALRLVGVKPGDEVFCSAFTFSASANPILYESGQPVFIDSERVSWNMDPARLEEALKDRAQRNRLPRAVILVHLYGQSADIDAIAALCARYGVTLIEDAAEALGATYYRSERSLSVVGDRLSGKQAVPTQSSVARSGLSEAPQLPVSSRAKSEGVPTKNPEPITNNRSEAATDKQSMITDDRAIQRGAVSPGTVGRLGIFSFNGNKIITTSGGGMLVSAEKELIERARFLATQARDPAPHYQHSAIGYNYRLSNVLAAIGRGQLRFLSERVDARRRNCAIYQEALADIPGLEFMPEAPWGRSSRWLTCVVIDPEKFGADRETIRLALSTENIEARPVWKPMHLQPVFAGCDYFGGGVAEDLFTRGLCLPSGSNLTLADLDRVVAVVRRVHG